MLPGTKALRTNSSGLSLGLSFTSAQGLPVPCPLANLSTEQGPPGENWLCGTGLSYSWRAPRLGVGPSLQPKPLTSIWLLLSVQVDVFRQNLFQEVSL